MSEYLETTVDKFIFRVAADRSYSSEGVWLKADGTRVTIGLTDFLQQRSGDVAFVELKPVGTKLDPGDEFAVIETIKVDISLYSPVGGTLVEVNTDLEDSPEAINQDPYGEGWMAVLEVEDWGAQVEGLMDARAYFTMMKRQAEEEASSV